MTIKHSLLAAMIAIASLSACGGGDNDKYNTNSVWVTYHYDGPTVVSKTDLSIGTGAEALAGKSVTVQLTQWKYSATAPEFKGDKYSGLSPQPPYTFTLTITGTPGMADAVLGMKVGGKRLAVIPGDMSKGEWVSPLAGAVPRLQPQVAEIELISVN